ncbi:hypothetical protein ARMGADRAFT_1160274 [Armillaria gallica]|uniref:HNH nuclease domain-containing protein n=1 Tax=Armillaria gallica TaxID=47427 RepID=A0A2H3EQ40_ARMGA|nr:hypothetical protein ARMGADRAFT_1160274 [Armillaria gallica]
MSNGQPCYELFIFSDRKDDEFLAIPVADIAHITKRLVKFLRFVGFCILGVDGSIMSEKGAFVKDDEGITEGKYYFVASGQGSSLVDPNVIGDYINSDTLYWTSDSHRDFRDKVVARDRSGLVTNNVPNGCGSSHIIPYAKGNAYISAISQARSHGNEPAITDIHDVRNGLLLFLSVKELFTKDLALIRTPNAVLNHDDLLLRETSIIRNLNMHGIADENYVSLVFTWLAEGSSPILCNDDDNTHRRSSLPADFLLEFAFGAMAVRLWASKCLQDRLEAAARARYPPQAQVPDIEMEMERINVSPEQRQIFTAMDTVMNFRTVARFVKSSSLSDAHFKTINGVGWFSALSVHAARPPAVLHVGAR